MKKCFKLLVIILFLMFNFMPFYRVEAASTYTVEMVANQTGNKVIGSYSSYSAALNAMNSQNSTASSVATIYRDGVPVDSKYAIFKFKPGSTYSLYTSSTTNSAYTSVSGSHGTDAAVLGYSDNGRVKIMISGFVGWTNINNGVVTPISLLGVNGNVINVPGGKGIRIRKSPSLSGSVIAEVKTTTNFNYTETRVADGYTWYKISYNGSDAWIAKTDSSTVLTGMNGLGTYYERNTSSNNLIHHFAYYNGSGYGDSYTNLGTAPTYLTPGVRYYSFDGNYFYSSLTTMLDDYRTGKYTSSVNANSPHYAYYLYLTSHSETAYTGGDLNNAVAKKGYTASNSKLYGTGDYFKEAEATYGQNALMMFGTAINESAWGTSRIAMDKNNLFGYGAADSDPYNSAYSYNSPRDSIMDYAAKTGTSYSMATGKYYYGAHYGNKASGRNVKYATDPYWGEKQASNSFTNDQNFGGKDFNSNTIGVVKKNIASPWIFDKPERTNEAHIYTLKNPNSNDVVNDLAVNVVDKVVGLNGVVFYKIYADLPTSGGVLFGYIPTEELYVSNNQPVINASDKTITEGSIFNPLEGVSATDVENGNLTNKITVTENNVNTSKEGTYQVTYTVSDNSNFHASKTINVKVISAELPEITASDRSVKQFEEFNYMEGVSAKAHDGTDLTKDITYDKTVDTSEAGTYKVTYKVKDSKGKEVSKTVTITVIPNEKPVINASDKEIYLNSDFDYLDGVTASDAEDGPIKDIKYEGEVKTDQVGDYPVTYTVEDKNGQVTTKTITVKVIVNQLPVINAYDKTIYLNSNFDPLEGVTASDKEDGPITKINVDKNDVKTDTLGKYEVTYSVTDSYGQTVTKTITVTVSEKVLEEKDGKFYLDYLKEDNGNLIIKGYNTIQGMNNNLENSIDYEIIFENQNTGKEFIQKLERITNKDEITLPIISNDGYDYEYSWFKGQIDINAIPAGDYTVYIKSISADYYSESLLQNMLLSEQISQFNTQSKFVTIMTDYMRNDIPVIFVVRDEQLGIKETSTDSNQYSYVDTIELHNDKLHLKGASYSVNLDMRKGTNLKRTIVFENIDTFNRYTYDLGYLEKGTFDINLVAADQFGKSKDLAWYEKDLDISNLPKGKYAIYIINKSNISDYGELNDVLFTDLSKASGKINDKDYRFYLNENLRNRIELEIK